MKSDVEAGVLEVISRVTRVPREQLRPQTDLRVELNVDSLQGLQIVAGIEKEFGVRVPDDELDNYDSVGAVIDTVRRLQRASG